MASLLGTEWTNAFKSPPEQDETVEVINREFNHAGLVADSDTIMLVRIPAGYSVIDIILEIVTPYEVGTDQFGTHLLGTHAFTAETGVIGSAGDANCYATVLPVEAAKAFRFPNGTTPTGRAAQTTDEVLVLTFGNLLVPGTGALRGVITMASTGL